MRHNGLALLPLSLLAALLACTSSGSKDSTDQVASHEASYGTAVVAEFDGYEDYAFPPMLPADEDHDDPWMQTDCLLCHETGISGAPVAKHEGMSHRLLQAKCRTCHVQSASDEILDGDFAANAFPPTLPHDTDHEGAWLRDDCMLCHETGVGDARKVVHEGMARHLLTARCRSCHVTSVPAGEADYPSGER